MTAANIHYLIGWIGAVIIIVTIGVTWALCAKYSASRYEDDETEGQP
jgi:hypothetical protein